MGTEVLAALSQLVFFRKRWREVQVEQKISLSTMSDRPPTAVLDGLRGFCNRAATCSLDYYYLAPVCKHAEPPPRGITAVPVSLIVTAYA